MSFMTMETNPRTLRAMAQQCRDLAADTPPGDYRDRLLANAAEYDQRAREVEMDDSTGQ
jgi:hypothetical protein